MKVSAFTIVKNARILEYPLVESILSILPIVDEYVVLVGKSDDDTLEMVQQIGSPKIRIIEDEWRDDIKKGGDFFSALTNIALDECTGDWAFYLQADEVMHEKDLPLIKTTLEEQLGNEKTKVISFRIRNFHGDYQTFNPYSHRKVLRIIRNNGEFESVGDAVTFACKNDPQRRTLQTSIPENILRLHQVYVFHYSWVKDKRNLLAKENLMRVHYCGDEVELASVYKLDFYYTRFRGSHPKVMEKTIAEFQSPFPPYPNRWLNPKFYKYLLQHGYKG